MMYRNYFRRGMRPRRLVWRDLNDIYNAREFLLGGTRGPLGRQFPAINAWIGDEGLVVSADLPGVNPDEIDISIKGDSLTLSGNRANVVDEEQTDEINYIRRERGVGEFSRTIKLPFDVDVEGVKANYTDGILKLELPRLPEEMPKKISVNVA